MVEEGLRSAAMVDDEPTVNGLCHPHKVLMLALEVVVRNRLPRSDLILDLQRQRSGGNVDVERKPFLRSATLGLSPAHSLMFAVSSSRHKNA
jgi:hypothetical protein